jgi:hydrogenase maturation protease
MSRIVVLGLGNLVHADDGAGVHAIEMLRSDLRAGLPGTNAQRMAEVTLLDGGTLGLALLPHLSGVDRLLVLDAVDAGEPAGTVMRFAGKSLHGLPGKPSVHQLGFADLLIALQLLGEEPREVVLLGIQPASIDWGCELTLQVRQAIPDLVEAAVRQLDDWAREEELVCAGTIDAIDAIVQ